MGAGRSAHDGAEDVVEDAGECRLRGAHFAEMKACFAPFGNQ